MRQGRRPLSRLATRAKNVIVGGAHGIQPGKQKRARFLTGGFAALGVGLTLLVVGVGGPDNGAARRFDHAAAVNNCDGQARHESVPPAGSSAVTEAG